MLSVMVCPSLKPRSSLGPESPTWPLLLISFSCFTHLEEEGDTRETLSQQRSVAQVNVLVLLLLPHHSLLKVILQSHVEVKRVSSVPEADADESTSTCEREDQSLRIKQKLFFFFLREFTKKSWKTCKTGN